MEKDTWRELPGILTSSSLEHFWVLYLVPAISRPGAGGKSIHFQINQVWHFLEEGEEERVAAALLFDLSLDLLLISTLQESSKGNLPPLDANGEQKHKPSQAKILKRHSVSLSAQAAL